MSEKKKGGITISPKLISLILLVGGMVWSGSAAYTSLQSGQEQLSTELTEHLTGTDEVVKRLDSLIVVTNHHLQWDTIYVINQGYLDNKQQEDIAEIFNRLEEVEKR